MSNSKGVLMFAQNNREIDYASMAYVSAKFVSKNLDVPVSLVTDQFTMDWIYSNNPDIESVFDRIIITDKLKTDQQKRYYDGSLDYKNIKFNNTLRALCYELSPYDQTLVIDTDMLIVNDKLKNVWDTDVDFMINRDHFDLAQNRDCSEFEKIHDYGIDFYWATVFYFRKTEQTKIFFDLCRDIVENYDFYKFIYQMPGHLMRNDYVFSVAIHIINGFSNLTEPQSLPCTIYYILDRDELYKVNSSKDFVFFVQKKNYLGEYTLIKTSNQNVHIMNKYSFNRNIPRMLEVLDDN